MSSSTPAMATASGSATLFQDAKDQWIAEGLVGGGAAENTVLQIAVIDLMGAVRRDSALSSSYEPVITAIKDLEDIPDASLTPAQQAQGGIDATIISRFFGTTPHGGVPAGRLYLAASKTWFSEPALLSHGIKKGLLVKATNFLRSAIRTKAPGSDFMPAVIWDLQDLRSASRTMLARAEYNRYGAELALLNYFFSQSFLGHNPVLTAKCIPPTSPEFVNCF